MSIYDRIIKIAVAILSIVALVLLVVIFVNIDNIQFKSNETEPTENIEATPEPTAEPTSEPTPETTPEPTPEPTEVPLEERPLYGLTICIDPGHQAEQMTDKEALAPWNLETLKTKCSAGTEGSFTHVSEYVVNLQISLKIRELLEEQGATVVMTRTNHNVRLSNIQRAEIGNDCNADVVLRIHCNGSSSSTANGIECWVPDVGDGTAEYKALAEYDYKLATELLTYLVDATNANRRYVNKSDNYTGLNWSTVPSIIVEVGFMSNEEEDRLLVTDDYQYKIAQGVLNWLLHTKVLKKN